MVATKFLLFCRVLISCFIYFSPVQGGVDSKNLFHNYIMVWVQDMQLNLLELCKAEKVSSLQELFVYSPLLSPSIEELCLTK